MKSIVTTGEHKDKDEQGSRGSNPLMVYKYRAECYMSSAPGIVEKDEINGYPYLEFVFRCSFC